MKLTLDEYLTLPWTLRRTAHDDDGEYIALEIDELPGFVVAGRTEDEVETLYWGALEEFLASYLRNGEEPPLPRGLTLPDADTPRARAIVGAIPTGHVPAWDTVQASSGAATGIQELADV